MVAGTLIAGNKRLAGIMAGATGLLLVPAVAMQFTSEVNWDETDFLVAGGLLFGTGLLFELAARKMRTSAYRLGAALALITAFVLTWGNLAVGLIGSEDNPANLMYVGVVALALLGAGLARFRPGGMATAMFVTAGAQLLTALVAQLAGWGFTWIINGVFALLWTAAGLCFNSRNGRVYPT